MIQRPRENPGARLTDEQCTALHAALERANWQNARFLIIHHARLDIPNASQITAKHMIEQLPANPQTDTLKNLIGLPSPASACEKKNPPALETACQQEEIDEPVFVIPCTVL